MRYFQSSSEETSAFKAGLRSAFTLVELLVVMGIVALLMGLIAPAFNMISKVHGIDATLYDIAGILENARTYAVANNTYVFVGFAETTLTLSPLAAPKPGVGRLQVVALASKTGTRGYDYYDANLASDWTTHYNTAAAPGGPGGWFLTPITKLSTYDDIHLANSLGVPPATGGMARVDLSTTTYQNFRLSASNSISLTPFSWPLGNAVATGKFQFTHVLTFDPRGIPRNQMAGTGNGVAQWYEIDLQQTNGAVTPPQPADRQTWGTFGAIMINGLTGQATVNRP